MFVSRLLCRSANRHLYVHNVIRQAKHMHTMSMSHMHKHAHIQMSEFPPGVSSNPIVLGHAHTHSHAHAHTPTPTPTHIRTLRHDTLVHAHKKCVLYSRPAASPSFGSFEERFMSSKVCRRENNKPFPSLHLGTWSGVRSCGAAVCVGVNICACMHVCMYM